MTNNREYMRLEKALKDATDDLAEVKRAWWWVTVAIPLSLAAVVAGALVGGLGSVIGVDTGSLAVALIVTQIPLLIWFPIRFYISCPKVYGSYSNRIVRVPELQRVQSQAQDALSEFLLAQEYA